MLSLRHPADISVRIQPITIRPNRGRPGRREAVGAQYHRSYLVVEGAGAAAFFFFLCFLAGFGASVVVPEAAGASADIGAAVFGISAAIEAAASPKVIKAEAIKIPDLFMASPAVGKLKAD
jgi:hypothetical protein